MLQLDLPSMLSSKEVPASSSSLSTRDDVRSYIWYGAVMSLSCSFLLQLRSGSAGKSCDVLFCSSHICLQTDRGVSGGEGVHVCAVPFWADWFCFDLVSMASILDRAEVPLVDLASARSVLREDKTADALLVRSVDLVDGGSRSSASRPARLSRRRGRQREV